jgi:signal transduction histidine kinase
MRLLLRDIAPQAWSTAGALPALDTDLRSSMAELEPLLSLPELHLWGDLKPQILELRARLFEAAAALEGGQRERAVHVMDDLVTNSSEIMNDLAVLNGLNLLNTEAAFTRADQRLRMMLLTGVGTSCALLVGIAATWCVVVGLVRRQRVTLDEYVQRVELANADLNAFAGRISHDMRNVLSPLLLAVSALQSGNADANRLKLTAERIHRMVSRALALLDALLTFSKAGQPSETHEVCSVKAELRAVIEELAPAAERLGAQLEVTMTPALDPRIGCSAGLLSIVLRNVIGNAVKFLDGEQRRTVRVEVLSSQAWCDVVVEDSGPGIPQEALPRIFDPFYRVPGTRAAGTGIGLATVQRIVQAHGGRVLVESARAHGTRVEVRFPLAPASPQRARRRSGPPTASIAASETRRAE